MWFDQDSAFSYGYVNSTTADTYMVYSYTLNLFESAKALLLSAPLETISGLIDGCTDEYGRNGKIDI